MSPSDPTDHALAAIASILDQPDAHRTPEPVAEEEKPLAPAHVERDPIEHELVEHEAVERELVERIAVEHDAVEPATNEAANVEPAAMEADGYSKTGPGPMAAIRFKWTVREHNGAYYVDETIGENSYPITLGPMSADAAIKLVDDRESESRRQFALLKSEMAGRRAAVNPARSDNGEM